VAENREEPLSVWTCDGRFRMRRERRYGDRVVACFAERPANVDAMFRRAAAEFPQADALVAEDGARLSYAALDERVERCAAGLAAAGLLKGDRLALLLGNRFEFAVANLACARLGLIAVPLNVRQQRPENEYAIGHCGARGLIFEADLAERLPRPGTTGLVRLWSCGGAAPGAEPFEALLAPARAPEVEVGEEEVCTILYTSGTTGRPKGAMLTHFGQVHAALQFELCHGFRRGAERCILCVPGSHVTGLTAILYSMLNVAGATMTMREFKADRFLAFAAREKLTFSILVPAMYNLCLLNPRFGEHDLHAWRTGAFGGAPMPVATIEKLAKALPRLTLVNAYGATETTSGVAMMPHGRQAEAVDSVGQVMPLCDIRVMDEEGREVPPGGSGELWIAGPLTIPGYWDNAEATRENFVGGYWKSGDIGSIDRAGFVRVFDRKKDMVNRAGYKVYSVEVENALSHHPDVIEAAVVARPDPVLGEKVQAFVVAKGEARDPEKLRAWCAQRISDYKVPDAIAYLDALPRNANGKIQKPALRAMVEQELGAPS
jgi:long-chain acyl-CoA synthetase